MAKVKGLKFMHEVVGPNKVMVAEATAELMEKLNAKFPMKLTSGKGKDKVTMVVAIAE